MKKTPRALALLLALTLMLALPSCGGGGKEKIVIWTSGEDYRNAAYLSGLESAFPDYDITLEYMTSSTIASKVREEGEDCSADIILSEEYNYLEMCEEQLATLEDFDFSQFLPELVPASHKYTPEVRNGGAILISPDILQEEGLPVPSSYDDLLDPRYRGLISMPSPTSSGTGYMFYLSLVNARGEEAALDYFERLSENILHYTSSGSGPINDLVQGEAAIGLGMTSQAVVEMKDGVNLEIVFPEEGSPYSLYGNAILAKSAERPAVREVFDLLATDLCRENNARFFPDQIFVDYQPTIDGFPSDVVYADMSGDTLARKEALLSKWNFG